MSTLIDSNSAARTTYQSLYNTSYIEVGQSFTSKSGTLDNVQFLLYKFGSPTGNVTAYIYNITGTYGVTAIPNGAAIATSDVVNITGLDATWTLITFSFSGVNRISLTYGAYYCVTVGYSGGDSSNNLNVGQNSGVHGGNGCKYISSWQNISTDAIFYVYRAETDVASPSVSSSLSPSSSASKSKSPSASVSASLSPSTSVSPSPSSSISLSVSASISPSSSISPSASESPSSSASVSPSVSSSVSLSISASISPSSSESVSVSPSVSASESVSVSSSESSSVSPSVSSSVSPSESASESASISPSASPSLGTEGYILDYKILPKPDGFERSFINIKRDYQSIDGKTSRDIEGMKERFILRWKTLSKSEADSILSTVEKNEAVDFLVNEDNLTINVTRVMVRINSKEYSILGNDYLVSLVLELTEETI